MNAQDRKDLEASLKKIGTAESKFFAVRLSNTHTAPIIKPTALEIALEHGGTDDLRRQAISQGNAFEYALQVDKGPHPDTRKAACYALKAYEYARYIDKKPCNQTRINSNKNACLYAVHVDQKPHPTTRRIASEYDMGYLYAVNIDRCRTKVTARGSGVRCVQYAHRFDNGKPTDETRQASWGEIGSLIDYIMEIDKCWHPKTVGFLRRRGDWIVEASRAVGMPNDILRKYCMQENAYKYAKYVDKGPHRVTRLQSYSYGLAYATDIDKGPHPVTYLNAVQHGKEKAYIDAFGPVSQWIPRFL